MPVAKPSPSHDHHGHPIVRPPDGGEIIPEHFHEGPATRDRFDKVARDVLSVPHAVVAKRQRGMRQRAAKARAKRRKAG